MRWVARLLGIHGERPTTADSPVPVHSAYTAAEADSLMASYEWRCLSNDASCRAIWRDANTGTNKLVRQTWTDKLSIF